MRSNYPDFGSTDGLTDEALNGLAEYNAKNRELGPPLPVLVPDAICPTDLDGVDIDELEPPLDPLDVEAEAQDEEVDLGPPGGPQVPLRVFTAIIRGVIATVAFARLRDPRALGFVAVFLRQGAGTDTVLGTH